MDKPRVILDSGAYTAWKQGTKIDIDKYAEFVIEYGHEFDNCFNLDEIGNTERSYKNWQYLKRKGANTIPIFHLLGGKEEVWEEVWLKRYLEQTDYIGIGAVASLDDSQRRMGLDRIWEKFFLGPDGLPKVKVHGLGVTSIDMMLRYPWYSVDSFTPVISAVWGSVLLPTWRDNVPRYHMMSICRISGQGNYSGDSSSSWLGLPTIQKDRCMALFEEHGFELGKVTYQKKKERRGKKGELSNRLHPISELDMTEEVDPKVRSLANHWETRMHWNLLMWKHLQDRMPTWPRTLIDPRTHIEGLTKDPKTLMYMGVSTTTHLQIFKKVEPRLNILISYAYCTPPIFSSIKDYTK